MEIDLSAIPSPCYVMNQKLLENNLRVLQLVQKEAGVEILCALKGVAFWEIFPLIGRYLSGGAASSLNEARLIYEKMGVKAHTYCPVFVEDEIQDIARYSSHIIFNSLSQYERFSYEVKEHYPDISFGLRVNPEYSEVRTLIYNPAQHGSRLGVIAGKLGKTLPEGIDGIHFHLLCEDNSYTLERTLREVEKRFAHLIRQSRWFNMGGGHHITRKDYDVRHLVDLLRDFCSRYSNLERVILEPGEAIGWKTGYLLSTVIDIVENKGVKTAMLDVSFAAHMPDCLEMPYKPVIIGACEPGKRKNIHVYRMGGTTCLAGDFMGMGDYAFEKPLKTGDKILFDDMMHYTMVKTTFFNGVKHPSIGMLKNGKFRLLREFGYEDYKNKLS